VEATLSIFVQFRTDIARSMSTRSSQSGVDSLPSLHGIVGSSMGTVCSGAIDIHNHERQSTTHRRDSHTSGSPVARVKEDERLMESLVTTSWIESDSSSLSGRSSVNSLLFLHVVNFLRLLGPPKNGAQCWGESSPDVSHIHDIIRPPTERRCSYSLPSEMNITHETLPATSTNTDGTTESRGRKTMRADGCSCARRVEEERRPWQDRHPSQ
jgi:hypothetical protein